MLTEGEIETLNQVERIALTHEYGARHLRDLVQRCREQQTTEGLAEMVAFSFNAQQFTPRYGGGGEQLPPGEKYKGVIVSAEPVNTTDAAGNVKGGYLALTLTPIEGPLAGHKQIDRLNLHHTNPKTVEIANEQMSAYCHVLNQFNIQQTEQLCNIPFLFDIGWQRGQEPSQDRPNGGYTEVKAIYDINGNAPGKAGAGAPPAQQQPPMQPPPQQPPAGVQPQPGAWGGAPPQQPPAQQPPPGQWGGQPPAQPPAATQPPAGGQWGQPPAQQPPPAQGGWGQQPPPQQPPAQQQPGPGPWGGPPQQ